MRSSIRRAAVAVGVATILVMATPQQALARGSGSMPRLALAQTVAPATLKVRLEACARIHIGRIRLLCAIAALTAHGYAVGHRAGKEAIKHLLIQLGYDCLADRLFRNDGNRPADQGGPCVTKTKTGDQHSARD